MLHEQFCDTDFKCADLDLIFQVVYEYKDRMLLVVRKKSTLILQ